MRAVQQLSKWANMADGDDGDMPGSGGGHVWDQEVADDDVDEEGEEDMISSMSSDLEEEEEEHVEEEEEEESHGPGLAAETTGLEEIDANAEDKSDQDGSE